MKKTLLSLILLSTFAFSEVTTLILVRHGETQYNQEGRVQGQIDAPLNKDGIQQAKELAEQMKARHPSLAAIYSSDLIRAKHTAQETAQKYNLPIQIRSSLREINWGIVEGWLQTEREEAFGTVRKSLDAQYPHWKDRWKYTYVPQAETQWEVLQRMSEELRQIAKDHEGKTVAVFSHGRAIGTLIWSCLDQMQGPYLDNCEQAIFLIDPAEEQPLLIFQGIES